MRNRQTGKNGADRLRRQHTERRKIRNLPLQDGDISISRLFLQDSCIPHYAAQGMSCLPLQHRGRDSNIQLSPYSTNGQIWIWASLTRIFSVHGRKALVMRSRRYWRYSQR